MIMRTVSIVNIFCLIAISISIANAFAHMQPRYEGQDIYAEPNCAIVTDHTRMFRDISDPAYYWICVEGEEKANYIRCPDSHAFMERQQRCVIWEEWKWIEPYMI